MTTNMEQVRATANKPRTPPYKLAGLILLLVTLLIATVLYVQFRGGFTDKTQLTLVSDRAGLVMDPGSKVTFNGVQIGRVAAVDAIERDGTTKAQLRLDVDPGYVHLIPANVDARIQTIEQFQPRSLGVGQYK